MKKHAPPIEKYARVKKIKAPRAFAAAAICNCEQREQWVKWTFKMSLGTYESLGMVSRGWGVSVGEDFLEEVLPSPFPRDCEHS